MIASAKNFLTNSFATFINHIVAAFITTFMLIMLSFSLASLLFTGELAPYLSQGVGIMLVSTSVGIVIMGILSHTHHILPSMQSSLILIIVTMSTNMVIATGKDLFITMLALLPLIALIIGVAFFIFGQFRWVKFIRYIPYPVIGGFLAGNGVLLISGALRVMMPFEVSVMNIVQFFQVNNLIFWIPGVVIAIALFIPLRRGNNYLVIPLILIIGVGAIYGFIYAQGLSLQEASEQGILLGDIGNIAYQAPINLDFNQIDWQAIQSQWANILTVMMVALIHLPLNLTGIELSNNDEFDIDNQVRFNGIMNIATALFGGNAGFSSSSISTMNYRIGGTSRLIYIISFISIVSLLILGSEILLYVPVAVLGGMLMFIGIGFIDEWIIQGLDKFTQFEYFVAFVIMLTVIFFGFLQGVVLGTFIMLLVFVGTYTRISNIYRATSARNLSSAVERNPHFTKELFKLREHVYVLELTGFLFFGTADTIIQEVKARDDDTSLPELKFLIIDFRRVAGVDSSALLSLNKIIRLAETHEFDVIFSDFEDNPSILRIITELSTSDCLEFSTDLDHALERAESELLVYAGTTQAFISSVVWMQLVDMGMSKKHAKLLSKYMERVQYPPETIIIKQGELADTLYFVEIGQVSIFLNFDGDSPIRLRTLGMGTVVGEIGFILERTRTATVVSDMHTFIWQLSKENLETMKKEDSELAFAFERMILKVVAQRLSNTNNLLHVLR